MDLKLNFKKLVVFAMLLAPVLTMAQSKNGIYFATEMIDYRGPKVFYDCGQSSELTKQFVSKPGKLYEHKFQTNEDVSFMVNGGVEIFLQPGDSLIAKVEYGEKRYEDVLFYGTPRAVLQNELMQQMVMLNRAMRYRESLLTCIVVLLQPKDRHNDSKKLMAKAFDLVEENKDDLSPEFCEYFLAGAEGTYLASMVEYPIMWKEIKKDSFETQGISDFWEIANDYKIRDSKDALNNPQYVSFLFKYLEYKDAKKAQQTGEKTKPRGDISGAFEWVASGYTGAPRDAVLYFILSSYARNGKDLDKVEPLIERYKKEYNLNKGYVKELTQMMQ